jgi:drug/metabolite transporter (DMT)-like permease
MATVSHIESLKYVPASIAYPMIRLNAVLVVLFSIIYFRDSLSPKQFMGIALAMTAIVILARELSEEKADRRNIIRGIILACLALLGGAIASISSKFAAIHTDKMAFMALSYIISTFLSLGLRRRFHSEGSRGNCRDAFILGVVMGVINLAGYYCFLLALSTGPLSIIASIAGMHFVIAILLSALVYAERLTRWRILGISLTVLSIALLKQ